MNTAIRSVQLPFIKIIFVQKKELFALDEFQCEQLLSM